MGCGSVSGGGNRRKSRLELRSSNPSIGHPALGARSESRACGRAGAESVEFDHIGFEWIDFSDFEAAWCSSAARARSSNLIGVASTYAYEGRLCHRRAGAGAYRELNSRLRCTEDSNSATTELFSRRTDQARGSAPLLTGASGRRVFDNEESR